MIDESEIGTFILGAALFFATLANLGLWYVYRLSHRISESGPSSTTS